MQSSISGIWGSPMHICLKGHFSGLLSSYALPTQKHKVVSDQYIGNVDFLPTFSAFEILTLD